MVEETKCAPPITSMSLNQCCERRYSYRGAASSQQMVKVAAHAIKLLLWCQCKNPDNQPTKSANFMNVCQQHFRKYFAPSSFVAVCRSACLLFVCPSFRLSFHFSVYVYVIVMVWHSKHKRKFAILLSIRRITTNIFTFSQNL